MKTIYKISLFFAFVFLGTMLLSKLNSPIVIETGGSLPKYSVDDLIARSEIIIIGDVITKLPSNWMGPGDIRLENASPKDVIEARGLFSDSLISVERILKGEMEDVVLRVRTFIGQTRRVIWANPSEPTYNKGTKYLLFLKRDIGPTAKIEPGNYIAAGALQGVYEIVDDSAIAPNDEWLLEDLIAYIEQSVK